MSSSASTAWTVPLTLSENFWFMAGHSSVSGAAFLIGGTACAGVSRCRCICWPKGYSQNGGLGTRLRREFLVSSQARDIVAEVAVVKPILAHFGILGIA